VGLKDYGVFSKEFGSTSGGDADFDGDFTVGLTDYGIFSGQCCGTRPADHVLTPEPDYEYHPGLSRVNKHFFVAGMRVASSARTWTAPSASLPPLLAHWEMDLPDAPAAAWGALYAALSLALLALALRRREGGLSVPTLRLRLGAAGTALLVAPALVASPCGVGPPPITTVLGTHGDAVLFYLTDPVGSTLLTVDAAGCTSLCGWAR
jgi:hypothetical protein